MGRVYVRVAVHTTNENNIVRFYNNNKMCDACPRPPPRLRDRRSVSLYLRVYIYNNITNARRLCRKVNTRAKTLKNDTSLIIFDIFFLFFFRLSPLLPINRV